MAGRIFSGAVAVVSLFHFGALVTGHEVDPWYVGWALLVVIMVYGERALGQED